MAVFWGKVVKVFRNLTGLFKKTKGKKVPNADPSIGATALFTAIQQGNFEASNHLILENPQLVHVKSDRRQTPLHYAMQCNNVEIAALLIQKGAKVHVGDNQGKTPSDYLIDNKTVSYQELSRLFYAILLQNYQKRGVDKLGRSNDKIFDGFGRAIYNAITAAAPIIGEVEASNAFKIAAQILQLEESVGGKALSEISSEKENKLLHLYEDLYICFTATKDKPSLRSGLEQAFIHSPYVTKAFLSSHSRRDHFTKKIASQEENEPAESIRERVKKERKKVDKITLKQEENLLLVHSQNDKNQTPLHYLVEQAKGTVITSLEANRATKDTKEALVLSPREEDKEKEETGKKRMIAENQKRTENLRLLIGEHKRNREGTNTAPKHSPVIRSRDDKVDEIWASYFPLDNTAKTEVNPDLTPRRRSVKSMG